MPSTAHSDKLFPIISVGGALALFAALQLMALRMTGGHFEYPLDDVYIHLAMAEQIWSGRYGVNASEYSSAASSILWPLLLVPFPSAAVQRMLPLFWNVVALVLAAWLWGRILVAAGWSKGRRRLFGFVFAAIGPIATLMVSTAYVGMEHTAHIAATLAILYGLLRYLQGQPNWPILMAGIFLAPVLRFEGLAFAILAGLVLLLTGERRRGLLALALAVVPVVLYTGFLVAIGLEPLPSSIQAKLALHGAEYSGLLGRAMTRLLININQAGGAVAGALTLLILVFLIVSKPLRESPLRWLALAVFGAGCAHLLFGQFGWLNRYEGYILTLLTAGFLVLLPKVFTALPSPAVGVLGLAPLAILSGIYLPYTVREFPADSRAIYSQQHEMARFAKDFLRAPVAVNDLGWVAWNNPDYVLDLWGLASSEARHTRLEDPQPGWAGPLAIRHDVPAAMIYDTWLKQAVGPDWVKLGELVLKERRGFLGGYKVSFYATDPKYVSKVRKAIDAWVPTLYPMVYFVYADQPKAEGGSGQTGNEAGTETGNEAGGGN